MRDEDRALVTQFSELPPEVQEKMMDMLNGAALAAEVMKKKQQERGDE